jgi:hypothetical protein
MPPEGRSGSGRPAEELAGGAGSPLPWGYGRTNAGPGLPPPFRDNEGSGPAAPDLNAALAEGMPGAGEPSRLEEVLVARRSLGVTSRAANAVRQLLLAA